MTTVENVFSLLRNWAPLHLAEKWDNVGLLAGDGSLSVQKALVALDITSEVCEEAVSVGAQLIISHHPVIFHPISNLHADGISAPVWQLARHGLSAICMHTNLDIAEGGVNDVLVQVLGLERTAILQPLGAFSFQKIRVYVPETHAARVRESMAKAGAGRYDGYDSCAFETHGTGYFRPLAGANPYIGVQGRLEAADEVCIEAVCDARDTAAVVTAMKAAHPYEVPAYDLFENTALQKPYGIGRVARLDAPVEPDAFARHVQARLRAAGVAFHDAGRPVQTVAVCSGAWDGELTAVAAASGADTILTGEIKHSDMLAAAAAKLNLVAAGHFATEQPICPVLARRLGAAFTDVTFAVAASGTEPVRFIN
ncbi:Nif3-like dinuclear metal center hexameric protein [Ethanoligenens sp.]|uniref:Nif3-like dinuclear metal center hexameric protein n=1 Tax=Ethanoligenens sp. TaxID=2099655 RepID=UPI0039E9FE22